MSTLTGHLLRVDLSSSKVAREPIPMEVQKKYVGGRGFGIHYLFEEQLKGMPPLDPQNRLIFMPGALGGSAALGFGRWIVMTKSPQTDGLARAVGGGNFAAFIKFAGFDLMIIQGKAEKPSYLMVHEDGCDILDAADLWGLDTQATQKNIAAKHGAKTQTACIGPAGERLVRYATITHGTRTASRCGVGTVMGAKNLKAIAITVKPRPPKAFHQEEFRTLVKQHSSLLREHKRVVKMHTFGTTFLAQMTREMGILPVRNFQSGDMEGIEGLFTDAYSRMRIGTHGCFNCITRCGQIHQVKDGPYLGKMSEGQNMRQFGHLVARWATLMLVPPLKQTECAIYWALTLLAQEAQSDLLWSCSSAA